MKFKFKNDSYRKNRGGISKFYNIYCNQCKKFLLLYQKDGQPGPLKRMYMDRIIAPAKFTVFQKVDDIKVMGVFPCPNCGSIIAKPYIYPKENRKSFLMKRGSFLRKVSSGDYPPLVSNLDQTVIT